MLTGELRSQIDAIWNAFWSGGISNPMEVMEQITYLLFIRRLDDAHTLEESKAMLLKQPMSNRIFPEGNDPKGRDYNDLRWSRFKHFAPSEMYAVVGEHVFPFIRSIGGDGSTYSQHMKDARFTIPTPALLSKVVDMLYHVPMEDRLSGFALSQFQRLAQFKTHDRWLFPNSTDTNHVCEKSITKQIDGRQNPKIQSNRSKANDVLVMPGGKWTSHDLRRTGATMMGNLGVHGDVIEKCLNHTEANSLKRVYQHQELKAEQAEAWRLLGDRLALLTGNSSNVVTFSRALKK